MNVDPDVILWVIIGLSTALFGTGGVAGILKLRNGKAQPPQQAQARQVLQSYPVAPVDPAGDTGRHEPPWMTDTQRNMVTPFGLTAGEMRKMAEDLSKAARNAPATAADVDNAVAPLRKEVSDFRQVFSSGLESVRSDMAALPCHRLGDDGCDLIEVPVPVQRLKQVKP